MADASARSRGRGKGTRLSRPTEVMLYHLRTVLQRFAGVLGPILTCDLGTISLGLLSGLTVVSIGRETLGEELGVLVEAHNAAMRQSTGALWRAEASLEARFGRVTCSTMCRRWWTEAGAISAKRVWFDIPY